MLNTKSSIPSNARIVASNISEKQCMTFGNKEWLQDSTDVFHYNIVEQDLDGPPTSFQNDKFTFFDFLCYVEVFNL